MKFRLVCVMVLLLAIGAGCKKTVDETLDWNKKIAVAYVHSYAVSIGAAVTEMKDDSTRIAYIRRAIDPISFYPDSSGYFYVYSFDCWNIAHARQKARCVSGITGKNSITLPVCCPPGLPGASC